MKKKYIAPVLDVIPMYDEVPFLKASRIIVKDGDEIIDIDVPEENTDADKIEVDSKKNNLWDINLWSD
ncbi:MAG: hypothetical protein SO049_03595 [Prevotella sp.]|nr:hypothetical protein [Bacteroidales bacterium]MDY3673894.1 hypothetical protein [Prevotella sp.]